MSGAGLYVYGVVRAGHPVPAGLGGVGSPPARLRLLTAGELAAVVSPVPAELLARRRDVMAHQDVLLALGADGPVAPMRFGAVARDEEAVLRELAANEPGHLRTLERLDGRLEINVKAFPVEGSLATLLQQDPQLRRLREAARERPGYHARVRLGEAVAGGLRRRAADAANRVLRALTPLSEAVAEGPEVANCVRNTSFLLRRRDVTAFREEAARRAAALAERAEVRVSGPLPCFSFAAAPGGRT